MMAHIRIPIVAVMTASALFAQPAQSQESAAKTDKTVWDGVYSEAQSARGKAQYEMTCSRCHREGPPRGDAFNRDWSGTTVDGLFGLVKGSMPADAPSSLSDLAYLDIVAYMLQINEFPAGRDELTADTIKIIRIQGRNGPEPVPNFALVRVVGCLTQGPESAWMMMNAAEPVRTRDPAASTGDELKTSGAAALGTQTFQLLNVYPTPEPYKGHKVEAKGFLIRNPEGNRINVTSVQNLAPGCN